MPRSQPQQARGLVGVRAGVVVKTQGARHGEPFVELFVTPVAIVQVDPRFGPRHGMQLAENFASCRCPCFGDLNHEPLVPTLAIAQHRGKARRKIDERSEEHTSELQSLMRTSYAVFCLKKKKQIA